MSQNWLGGACHKTCISAPHFDQVQRWNDVIEYSIPMKNDDNDTITWALNWPRSTNRTWKLEEYFNNKISSGLPDSVLKKYQFGLSFLENNLPSHYDVRL
jgi:hypothetical protein